MQNSTVITKPNAIGGVAKVAGNDGSDFLFFLAQKAVGCVQPPKGPEQVLPAINSKQRGMVNDAPAYAEVLPVWMTPQGECVSQVINEVHQKCIRAGSAKGARLKTL